MSFLPQVREFKRVLESRFNDVETGFQELDSIPNSNRKREAGFHTQIPSPRKEYNKMQIKEFITLFCLKINFKPLLRRPEMVVMKSLEHSAKHEAMPSAFKHNAS